MNPNTISNHFFYLLDKNTALQVELFLTLYVLLADNQVSSCCYNIAYLPSS
jgi:hypothetical protein